MSSLIHIDNLYKSRASVLLYNNLYLIWHHAVWPNYDYFCSLTDDDNNEFMSDKRNHYQQVT